MAVVETLQYNDIRNFYLDLMCSDKFGRPELYVFRGQGDSSWKLRPFALRVDGLAKLKKLASLNLPGHTLSQVLMLEANCVKRFCIKANDQGISAFKFESVGALLDFVLPMELMETEFIPEKYLDMYALAQHYGIPTRLLDWSRNALVAAFFAVSSGLKQQASGKDGSFAIWMLRIENIMFSNDVDLRMAVPIYATNPNIRAQQGVMTYSKKQLANVESEFKEDAIPPLEEMIGKSECWTPGENGEKKVLTTTALYKIEIPYSGLGNSAEFIYRLGYTHSRIFPGLADIVVDMENPMAGQR